MYDWRGIILAQLIVKMLQTLYNPYNLLAPRLLKGNNILTSLVLIVLQFSRSHSVVVLLQRALGISVGCTLVSINCTPNSRIRTTLHSCKSSPLASDKGGGYDERPPHRRAQARSQLRSGCQFRPSTGMNLLSTLHAYSPPGTPPYTGSRGLEDRTPQRVCWKFHLQKSR
jgi:hypothetical protein